MTWLRELFLSAETPATCIFLLGLVVVLGLILGNATVRGVRFGVAGVLFVGLLIGHFGLTIDHTVLEFTREFGLILFVYAVGITVGPGFFNSLQAYGMSLNLLAVGVVLGGLLTTLGCMWVFGISLPIAAGIFSGATTNTPSLAAVGQTLREHPLAPDAARAALAQAGIIGVPDERLAVETIKLPGLGYAVAYPLGVFGIIGTMLALRMLFRVDPKHEAELMLAFSAGNRPKLERRNILVTNPNLNGRRLQRIPGLEALEIVVSRIFHDGVTTIAHPETLLHTGDVLLAVGTRSDLDDFQVIVGEKAEIDLMEVPSSLVYRWVTLTQSELVGAMLGKLALEKRFSVQVTRIRRAAVELPAQHDEYVGLGDQLLIVGEPSEVDAAAAFVGDKPSTLEQPELIPAFVGICLGVILGSIPFSVPGFSAPVKLGLAGGPLLVAILLSRIQRVGPLVFHLPRSAALLLRDLGIVLFLAAVGMMAGDRFADSLLNGDGLLWLLVGVLVTIVPLLIVAALAFRYFGVRYTTLVGVLAGSMTDPPALAFANAQSGSELPAIAYATVYPTAMILRVLCAQGMVLAAVS